jgi:hypothetical protein
MLNRAQGNSRRGIFCVYLAEEHPPNIHLRGKPPSKNRVIIEIPVARWKNNQNNKIVFYE